MFGITVILLLCSLTWWRVTSSIFVDRNSTGPELSSSLFGTTSTSTSKVLPRTRNNTNQAAASSSSASRYEIVDGSLYKIVNNELYNREVLRKSLGMNAMSRVTSNIETNEDRQKQNWDFISTFDSFKTSVSYTPLDGKPTLENFKYIVLPIWWSDMDTSDSSLRMDPSAVAASFIYNQQYYSDMSWGKMTNGVTYEVMDQRLFASSSVEPSFWDTESNAQKVVDDAGYVNDEDYNGICLMYFVAQAGVFSGAGGWAGINGVMSWSTYPGWGDVTRHEVGHNFGHPHHLSVSYEHRNKLPADRGEGTIPYDGFDMMSGGNAYEISHFAAASKWFFNWIPDSSIILMQPEGSTSDCPYCYSSGTFTLKPFDDKDLDPTPARKMGIHIPIVVIGNRLYSYWLSYRSGVEGRAQNGLSMHLSWFDVGGHFGASYDSLNFDAFGNTDSTEDSFVIANSCYHMSAPGYLKDESIVASEMVNPVVCVDSIVPGSSITVSVSFLDKENPPTPQVSFDQEVQLECSTSGSSTGTVTLNASSYNLIHVQNSGNKGAVALQMCTSGGTVSAYFHDEFPYSTVSYGSEAAYGSYKSLTTSKTCSSQDSLTYQSAYGQTYILLPPVIGVSSVEVAVSCLINECLANQYLSNGSCTQCPNDGRSSPGLTALSACEECPGGTFLPHPRSDQCALSDTYEEITSATAWRIWAPDFDTSSGWVMDVGELEFYDNVSCSGIKTDTSGGIPLDSGNAGGVSWVPSNAFDDNISSAWGGRTDSDDIFYVGMDFGTAVEVRCVKLYKTGMHYALNVRVQAYSGGRWKNAWIEENLSNSIIDDSLNVISMDYSTEPTPTKAPSKVPTAAPNNGVTNCVDSPLRFKLIWKGEKISRKCTWVKNKQTSERCAVPGVSETCPNTCDTCSSRVDSPQRFKLTWKGKNISRSCTWVKDKQTLLRCAADGVSETCCSTCGLC